MINPRSKTIPFKPSGTDAIDGTKCTCTWWEDEPRMSKEDWDELRKLRPPTK